MRVFTLSARGGVYEFLANVHTWLNERTAEAILTFKGATDVFGGNLLERTVVPFITDMGDTSLRPGNIPALIFGGKALGMQGGQYRELGNVPHNNLWMSIAQAFLRTSDPLPAFADEVFVKTGVAPLAGLWAPP